MTKNVTRHHIYLLVIYSPKGALLLQKLTKKPRGHTPGLIAKGGGLFIG